MRFTLPLVAAIVGFAAASSLEARVGSVLACGNPKDAVPLLRAYSAAGTDHFYTTNVAEFKNAVTHLGCADQGTTGYVFPSHEVGAVPLYRLYNAAVIDHFYTASATERDSVVQNLGYTIEGITGYVYLGTACGPLYRLNNGSDHFYTMFVAERDNAVHDLGYILEGIACYIISPGEAYPKQTATPRSFSSRG